MLSARRSRLRQDVELIAAKTYSRGIVLHSVLFDNSLYAVLADADDDQPLLDVAFPDVTARCRGLQIKAYDMPAKEEGLVPRRLSVWEGRRRGAMGVGWGTAAALAAAGAAVPKDGSIVAGANLKHVKTEEERKAAARAAGASGKEADDDGEDDAGKAADEPATSSGKEADDDVVDVRAQELLSAKNAAREAAAARAKERADADRRRAAASSKVDADDETDSKRPASVDASESKRAGAGGAGAGSGSGSPKKASQGAWLGLARRVPRSSRSPTSLREFSPFGASPVARTCGCRLWRACPTSHRTPWWPWWREERPPGSTGKAGRRRRGTVGLVRAACAGQGGAEVNR